jgi:hypothetical protein
MSVLKSPPNVEEIEDGKPIYLVFKYIPDIYRMEPRNVGVLVWHEGAVCARFLDPAPEFVKSPNAYRKWVEYWSEELRKPEAQPLVGKPIPVTDKRFLRVLQDISDGNFYLALGGAVSSPIENVQEAAEYLFGLLVL